MFGPNAHFETTCRIDHSHRDQRFFDLFKDVRALFAQKFNLTDYDILFLPGSGTVGIEAVLFSLNKKVNVLGHDGVFKNRWLKMAEHYNPQKKTRKHINLACQLETSMSALYTPESDDPLVVDAISAFPYYDLPENMLIMVTASNKQLQSFAGLSIVAVKKDFWPELCDESAFSYLNLGRYQSYHNKHQTPSTAPTYLFEHFGEVLENFSVEENKKRIDYISDLLVDAIGEDNVVGEKRCPVITVKQGVVPQDICTKYDLYGHWTGKSVQQIFTYSCPVSDYESFCKEIKKAK